MREVTIGKNEAGQRLDKFLAKYMRLAGKGFLYKMIRKKNIVLNGKRCEGSELLAEGDVVKLFLSDETIERFSEAGYENAIGGDKNTASSAAMTDSDTKLSAQQKNSSKLILDIVYEDDDIILINKPSGMLAQKAKESDVSLVEYLIDYLFASDAVTKEELRSFRPSVCNRLDRNTSGIVAAGKSLAGLQMLSEVFRDRSVHKYYRCIVSGEVKEAATIDGWLVKDERTNTVRVSKDSGSLRIVTRYEPLASNGRYTLLNVTLITGRSHQIRAHLASIEHPIVGDRKYGKMGSPAPGKRPSGKNVDEAERRYHIRSQLLHSYRLVFPELTGKFAYLSGRSFEAELPKEFKKVAVAEGLIT